MVNLTCKTLGLFLKCPATWPAVGVLLGAAAIVGAGGYCIEKVSKSKLNYSNNYKKLEYWN